MTEVNKKLDAIKEENGSLRSELHADLTEVKNSLDFNSNTIEKLSSKNESLEKELVDLKSTLNKVLQENKMLKSKVDDLSLEVIELQQYSRRCNIEVSDIPEASDENIENLTNTLLKSLNVDETCKVITAHRVPVRNPKKIKPIIIQLQSKTARDICIKTAKAKKLLASDINPTFTKTPIYVSEHLCPAMKSLFFQVRKFKKEQDYKYCWVRDSKIFLRKSDESKAIKIQKSSDLINVSE